MSTGYREGDSGPSLPSHGLDIEETLARLRRATALAERRTDGKCISLGHMCVVKYSGSPDLTPETMHEDMVLVGTLYTDRRQLLYVIYVDAQIVVSAEFAGMCIPMLAVFDGRMQLYVL